jgi:hypothetical protein
MTLALAKYDAMRLQVAQCARVDEAAELRNRADKMRAYAKQKKDHELHRWMGEIFCRATLRYGELSKSMEKSPQAGGGRHPSGGKPTKKDAIKASGLSTSAAQRAEALAGARSDLDDQMQVEALGIGPGDVFRGWHRGSPLRCGRWASDHDCSPLSPPTARQLLDAVRAARLEAVFGVDCSGCCLCRRKSAGTRHSFLQPPLVHLRLPSSIDRPEPAVAGMF